MKTYFRISVILITFFSAFGTMAGQYNSTTYFMSNLPQSTILNPALHPGCSFHISFPGFTSDIGNTTLSVKDIFTYLPEEDLYVHPFDTLATTAIKNDFLSKLDPLNSINMEVNANIFNIGFRTEDAYIAFHIAQRFGMRFDYSDDFVRILVNGIENGQVYDWSNIGIRVRAYQEYGVTFSKEVDNYLTYGIRAKLLFGQVDFDMKRQDITLEVTSPFDWQIHSEFEIDGRVPWFTLYNNPQGELDSLDSDLDVDELLNIAMKKKNIGFALDLGVNYNVNDRFSISASALDIGFINWKDGVFNLSNDSEYDFSGVEKTEWNTGADADSTGFMDMLLDSIRHTFTIESTNEPYMSLLTGKILFGLNYKLGKNLDIGVLSYTEIYRSKFFPRLTLSANFRPIRMLNFSFSYSVLNQEYNNMGFGLSLKLLPFNTYIIIDTVPLEMSKDFMPYSLKSARIQTGFNLVFGQRKREKAENDNPLVNW